VAADVHGKNHHAHGSIARFVESIEMILADGSHVTCSATEHEDLFAATIGGMGLTGFMYSVCLRMLRVDSAFLSVDLRRTADLANTCRLLLDTQNEYTYSVAWIDCARRDRRRGRGIVMLGNHADVGDSRRRPRFQLHPDRSRKLPLPLPGWALNRAFVQTFNTLYWYRHWSRSMRRTTHYDSFFYPLDAVENWNLIYGRRGFLQYQFVVPFANGIAVIDDVLDRLQHASFTPTLAVLKTFGDWPGGMLSFPMPGYTLALDMPVADGRVIEVLHTITAAVTTAGGRVYLAKDAVVGRDDFAGMYPRLAEFRQTKERFDPTNRFRSCLSDRLGLS
jgi:decaprenylphospho-beta-D-ribofuranose 2-oxidase